MPMNQDVTAFGSECYVTDLHGHDSDTLPIISYNFVRKILLQRFYGTLLIMGKKLSVISRAASYIINVTAKMTPLSVI